MEFSSVATCSSAIQLRLPVIQGPGAICIDTMCYMCDVDEAAKVDHCEPLRKINLARGTAPPRRFYRTFWRSLAFRLTKLDSAKRRQTEAMAN